VVTVRIGKLSLISTQRRLFRLGIGLGTEPYGDILVSYWEKPSPLPARAPRWRLFATAMRQAPETHNGARPYVLKAGPLPGHFQLPCLNRSHSRHRRPYFDCSETGLEAGLPFSTTRVAMNFTGLSLGLMAR
jgi:hypothetical protein